MTEQARRKCFVIGPIGDPDTDVRDKADLLLNLIIQKALEEAPLSFEVTRADKFPEPGLITAQIINAVITSDLIVADLTGWNPNVFYELALAHTEEKPVIHMIEDGEKLPFDLKDCRAISYRVDKFERIEAAKKELNAQAKAAMAKGYEVSNPVTSARGRSKLARSGDPMDKLVSGLIESVANINRKISRMEASEETKANAARRIAALPLGLQAAVPLGLQDVILPRGRAGMNPQNVLSLADLLAEYDAGTTKGDESEAAAAPTANPLDPNLDDD